VTERRDDSTLSTADMVSAASGQTAPTAEAQPRSNGSAAPAMPEPRTNGAAASADGQSFSGQVTGAPLLPNDRAEGFRSRWEEIQTGFVDEPRQAVEQADHLVAEVIKRVAEVFAEERSKLESQWSSGNEVDTEALRQALKRYRSFFERLLST
jgi:hypothetical protein